MGTIKKPFTFRWTLYILKGEDEIAYVILADCAYSIVSLVMQHFIDGLKPVPPWSLHLQFHAGGESFELRPEHFTNNGKFFTQDFINKMNGLDPLWVKFPKAVPLVLEAATKKKLHGPEEMYNGSYESLQNFLNPKEPTFHSVIGEVFGRPGPAGQPA